MDSIGIKLKFIKKLVNLITFIDIKYELGKCFLYIEPKIIYNYKLM